MLYKRGPKLNNVRIFDSNVYIFIDEDKRDKLQPRATEGVFDGYDEQTKGYRCFLPSQQKIRNYLKCAVR